MTSDRKSIICVPQMATDAGQITASGSIASWKARCDWITAQANSVGPDPVK